MKLCPKSLAVAAGLVWGGGLFLLGVVSTINGSQEGGYYAKDFLLAMASIYPGYGGVPGFGDAVIGGLYGFLDGAVVGGLLALVYNALLGKSLSASS